MEIFIVLFFCFLTFYFLTLQIAKKFYKNKKIIHIRLWNLMKFDSKSVDNQLNQSLYIRVIYPIISRMGDRVLKATPKDMVNLLERKIQMAGMPFGFSSIEWLILQIGMFLILPVITIGVGYYIDMEINGIVLLIIVELCILLVFPNFILNRKVNLRQREIKKSLPNVLDLLTVSVEAGLGFDGALARVVDKMRGALAKEFENVLQEIKIGEQKRDALKRMSERLGIDELSTFIGSIIQADQLGVSIGNVLRIQSEQIREKRRQEIKEKAMKAPVKMLIPMIIFIFPTIFSVLIGPVIIKVIYTLGGAS